MALGGCDIGQVRPQTDADTIKYSRQGYEALFTVGTLLDIEIVISTEEWLGLLQDMVDYARDDTGGRPMTGNYRSATFVYRATPRYSSQEPSTIILIAHNVTLEGQKKRLGIPIPGKPSLFYFNDSMHTKA